MAKKTITDVYKLLADPTVSDEELRKLFVLDEEKSGPFNPVLKLRDSAVKHPETPEEQQRAQVAMASMNWFSRMRRHAAFNARMADSSYTGPVIVSEGDSWFQYPVLLTDTIDHLMKNFAILSLGAAGDTLEEMIKKREFISAIQRTNASLFLLSAGGNDVLGGGALASLLRPFDSTMPNVPPESYVTTDYTKMLGKVIGQLDHVLRDVGYHCPGVTVLLHGYDHAIPNKGKWLGKPMESIGIKNKQLQQDIIRVIVTRFNGELERLCGSSLNADYVNVQATVGKDRWHDELHPEDEGYGDVATHFEQAIHRQLDARATPAARQKKAQTPVIRHHKGLSLHIGLNFVDKNHYAGWDGELVACEYDAEDMKQIAETQGFDKPKMLLTEKATRKAVIEHIEKAAKQLEAGDLFLITYSGHGGQVPDFNSDEPDALDETWCLHDSQLIDDELFQLWAKFRYGVRILVISDSCHSGSVVRTAAGQVLASEEDLKVLRVRAMPRAIAARTFRNNRDFYTRLGSSLDAVESRVTTDPRRPALKCSVRLLSGCQDHQYSYDGLANGRFTEQLLRAWNEGLFEGNYDVFCDRIKSGMPENQLPNHMVVGEIDPAFDAQKPFTI